jgi:hypothetical protein
MTGSPGDRSLSTQFAGMKSLLTFDLLWEEAPPRIVKEAGQHSKTKAAVKYQADFSPRLNALRPMTIEIIPMVAMNQITF